MRRFLTCCVAALLSLALTSCGGSRVTVKKDPPKEKAPEPPPVPAAPVTRVETPPLLPDSAKPAATGEKPAAGTEKPATVNAKPVSGGGEFSEGLVGGKPIETWLTMLDSEKKDDVIQAINACAVARVKKSVDKLTALTKHADKEIASDAEFALKKIGAGK